MSKTDWIPVALMVIAFTVIIVSLFRSSSTKSDSSGRGGSNTETNSGNTGGNAS